MSMVYKCSTYSKNKVIVSLIVPSITDLACCTCHGGRGQLSYTGHLFRSKSSPDGVCGKSLYENYKFTYIVYRHTKSD